MILRIREACVCGPHSLRLAFSDGTTKKVNVRPLLEGTVFEPLQDPSYFATVTLDPVCGTVVWPNGADFRRRPCTSWMPRSVQSPLRRSKRFESAASALVCRRDSHFPHSERLMANPQTGRSMACRDFQRLRISRRAWLRVGASWSDGTRIAGPSAVARSSARPGIYGFGRAKSCILIFLWGGPSQLDTWDPKPRRPKTFAGRSRRFRPAPAGISISEHFPLLARQAHRLAIVRR